LIGKFQPLKSFLHKPVYDQLLKINKGMQKKNRRVYSKLAMYKERVKNFEPRTSLDTLIQAMEEKCESIK
jgi:hypothetical protein